MGVATVVSIIGFSAMTLARMKLKSAQSGNESTEAVILSQSAIEYAMANIHENSSWRNDYAGSTEVPGTPLAVGNGTVTFKLVDDDGSLSDDTDDLATLYGIGRVGDTVHVQSVVIQPSGSEMEIVVGSWKRTAAP